MGALLAACGPSMPAQPALPQSATPGWTRVSLEKSTAPDGLKAECWKARYTGRGEADILACGFASEGTAFEAVQKSHAVADTVRFQEGQYYVVAHWSGATRDDVTALVRGVQRALKAK